MTEPKASALPSAKLRDRAVEMVFEAEEDSVEEPHNTIERPGQQFAGQGCGGSGGGI